MANTHEHLEHAEHAGHPLDPFDKRVAVSVAVVAAVLAGLSMLGHRKHNEVLQLQGDANRKTTEASILHTRATDKWGEYQAVNIRDHGYEFAGKLAKKVAADTPALASTLRDATAHADAQHKKYDERLPGLKNEAEKLGHDGEAKIGESLDKIEASHHAHHQADRLDFAHLGAELGIVLCSLALLTKRKVFWFAGVLAAVLAVGTGASAYLLPNDPHVSSHAPTGNGH